jgi:hypothetical protein
MSRNLLSALFAILALAIFAPQLTQAQVIIDTELTAATQADLPAQSANYTPCCNWVHWTFSWHNYYTSITYAIMFARIYGTNVNLYIENSDFNTGDRSMTGDTFTGTGMDGLWVDDSGGSYPNIFTNMKWSVHYYDKMDD